MHPTPHSQPVCRMVATEWPVPVLELLIAKMQRAGPELPGSLMVGAWIFAPSSLLPDHPHSAQLLFVLPE